MKDQLLCDIVLVVDNQELFIHADGLVAAVDPYNVVPEKVGVRVRELLGDGFLLAGPAYLDNNKIRYVIRGPRAAHYVNEWDDGTNCE